MKIIGVHHVAIIASDYEKSKKFYVETLGLRVLCESFRAERHSWKLDLALPGGGQIELFSFPNPPSRVSGPEACGLRHFAFAVENVDDATTRLISQGIPVETVRIDPLTGRKFTFFTDPDGLPLELYET